jgi:hypothetical protein
MEGDMLSLILGDIDSEGEIEGEVDGEIETDGEVDGEDDGEKELPAVLGTYPNTNISALVFDISCSNISSTSNGTVKTPE